MLSKIRQTYTEFSNSPMWGDSIEPFLKYSASSLAFASLAQRMWITANQLDIDPRAREQVFRAGQRLFSLAAEQRETSIDFFAKTNRVGALSLGLLSVIFALKALRIR